MASLIDKGISRIPGPVEPQHVLGAFGFAGRECPELNDVLRLLAEHSRLPIALAMGLNVMLELLPSEGTSEDESPE